MSLEGICWAIEPIRLGDLGDRLFARQSFAKVHKRAAQSGGRYGYAAILPVWGVLTYRPTVAQQVFGGTSIQKLYQQFRAALLDKNVLSIVFDVDSPGGEADGIMELANFIFRSRGKKRTIAVANSQACSAAYWLAASAGELVVEPSAQVGSIGVFAEHDDCSGALEKAGVKMSLVKAGRYKTDGNPFEPLSESAREDMQSKVNAFYNAFVADVARGRGVPQATVRNGFGCGRSVLAENAVRLGMADRVATLDETMTQVVSGLEAPMLSSSNASVSVLSRQLDRRIAQTGHVPPGIARRERELRERMGRD